MVRVERNMESVYRVQISAVSACVPFAQYAFAPYTFAQFSLPSLG